MPGQGAVVQQYFAVHSLQLAVAVNDERIDLGEAGVAVHESAVEVLGDFGESGDMLFGQSDAVGQLAGLVSLHTQKWVNVNGDDLFWRLGGDLFDFDAPLAAGHDRHPARAAVEDGAQIDFGADVSGLVHQDFLHGQPFDVHAEDLCGHFLGLIRRAGQLDAAGLAAPPDQHLTLDDDRLADLFSDGARFGRRGCDFPVGDGHAISGEDSLRLVFV